MLNTEQASRKKVSDSISSQKAQFNEKIANANDLSDNLQDLLNHLQKFTNSSAVYIGKLVSPKKEIKDGDDDFAHIDETSDKIITFSHSNEEHDFLVDKVLNKGDGLTFDVFADKFDEEGVKIVGEDLEHVLIKEVVRENRIKFFRVPKLGSYLAIRLEYNSCLFVESYNDGVRDALSVRKLAQEQEEARREHDEKEAERKEECDANDQEYEYDAGEWPEIEAKPFTTQSIQYVICLNTMGQDREFTQEEIRYALDTVKMYRNEWESIEKDNLKRDIDRKLENMESERVYRETNDALD